MSSGVQATEECLTVFEQMKLRSQYSYIIFKITDDKKYIEIETTGEKGESFESFTSKLPEGDCRYAVLDVEIQTKSGATTNKLIFIAWSDDNAPVKPKMLYASSKDALKKMLTGINEEFQATEKGDLNYAEIQKKAGSV
mmetsp:Transcript_29223/g.72921  ORF Transcript_29223/g.72921 Transcript_29223/m.72921 type:complete len:139 (-) Transcript_29223:510-926(-)